MSATGLVVVIIGAWLALPVTAAVAQDEVEKVGKPEKLAKDAAVGPGIALREGASSQGIGRRGTRRSSCSRKSRERVWESVSNAAPARC